MLNYVATVAQTGTLNTLFIITLSADGVSFGEVLISGGIINGNELKFGQFTFSEKTTAGGIALVSTGDGTVAGNGSITATLSGIYQTPSGATCTSHLHQLLLTRK